MCRGVSPRAAPARVTSGDLSGLPRPKETMGDLFRAAEAQAGRQEIERLYKELQSAFERASEAEAARRSEQLKSALLDALTHNLRTPLTSIKAAVTALIRSGAWTAMSELSSEGRRE